MGSSFSRGFDTPDEVIDDARVREEVVNLSGVTVGRFVIQPGFRWSSHVGPRVNTDLCQARHVGVSISGHLRVLLADGIEYDIEPGEVFVIPPGHDIWVIGDEPATTIEWAGALSWHPGPEGLGDRVLATLLMSDIVDSTATAQRLGDRRWKALLKEHDSVSDDVVSRYRGTVLKGTGDGILAMFSSAERAVRAAVELGPAVEPLGVRLRVGVHTGEVDVVAGDVHGVTVHAVARIAGLGSADEVLVSAATAGLDLGSGTTFESQGVHALKGLEGEYEVFRASARR